MIDAPVLLVPAMKKPARVEPKRVSALTARRNFGQLLEEVYYRGNRYVIERAGRPMAAVVPVAELAESRKRRARFFYAVQELWEKNRVVPSATLDAEVVEAVRAVRARGTRRR
jgi:prevent-host-death family protein